MIQEFRLPDLGEGLPEAELVQWLVAEGDAVSLNQTIAEVETAKAVVELPSPYIGVVTALHAAPGDVVDVGAVLIGFDVAAETSSAVSAPAEAAAAAPGSVSAEATPAETVSPPNLVGYGAAAGSSARPQRRARVERALATPDSAVLEAAPHDAIAPLEAEVSYAERPRSTPPVRKLAKDLGVDLALVEASGISGLITRDDVRTYADRVQGVGLAAQPPAAAVPASQPSPSGSGIRRIPIRGVRKLTAEAMTASAFTAPHVTVFHTVDVTATTELLDSLRADRALQNTRIGVLAVAAKAVCLALRRTPGLNSRWDGEHGEILEYGFVNLGIAAATHRGLVVPNIRDAGTRTLVELADAIRQLAETARSGKTAPTDMTGGTFSISNIGVFGVEAGTPIINPGEAGILALGAVQRRPWEHRGEVALRDVMTLSLSFDHRLVDGAEGSRFLVDVADVLREPGRAMLLG